MSKENIEYILNHLEYLRFTSEKNFNVVVIVGDMRYRTTVDQMCLGKDLSDSDTPEIEFLSIQCDIQGVKPFVAYIPYTKIYMIEHYAVEAEKNEALD